MLVEFLLFITPGTGLMVMILKFVKKNAQISIARTDAVRATARLENADAVAREALGQTSEALAIARTIETVDEKVDFIVAAINGNPPARRQAGKHTRSLPSSNDTPAIGSGGMMP